MIARLLFEFRYQVKLQEQETNIMESQKNLSEEQRKRMEAENKQKLKEQEILFNDKIKEHSTKLK